MTAIRRLHAAWRSDRPAIATVLDHARLHVSGPIKIEMACLSPLGFGHINMLGRYAFTLPDAFARGELPPRRNRTAQDADELVRT